MSAPQDFTSIAPVRLSDLASLPAWIAWRNEKRGAQRTKVPYSPLSGRKAEADNPASWGSYAQALAWARQAQAAGVGIMFAPISDNLHFGGIDLDTCRDPRTGAMEDWAVEVVNRFASYTEISPSLTGVKIFFTYRLGDEAELDRLFDKGKSRKTKARKFARGGGGEHSPAIEIYLENRFFTVTGQQIGDIVHLSCVSAADVAWLINQAGPAFLRDANGAGATPVADLLAQGGSTDNSRSGRAWREGLRLKLAGASFEQMRDALLNSADPDIAAWADEKGLANDERELRRIYEKAGASPAHAPLIEPAGDVDATRFRWSDSGNSLLFVALFKENIRYIEAWKTWLLWNDGRRWIEASDTAMLPLARVATERMFADAAKMTDASRQEALRKHALASQREPRLRAMLALAKGEADIRVAPNQLDADPFLLGCPNGTLDLRTGELREARREDFITKSTAVAYDPTAQCPDWLGFLQKIFPNDAETIEHLQRVAGYALTGDVSEEKLFPLCGLGQNGKTTFSETFIALLGDYAAKGSRDLLLERQGKGGAASPDVAALHGKRLVAIGETNDGCALDEAQVKSITSNARIAARRLHRDPFDFMPTHKVWLDTNHRPCVRGTDDGIWRRINTIGFGVKIAEADKIQNFRETRLMPRGAGILRWAVGGCRKWLRDGLKASEKVKQATAEYRSAMDSTAQWIEDRHAANASPRDFTPGALAYSDYVTWTQAEHYRALGRKKFSEELNSRGFGQDKSNGVRGFRGLKLKPMRMAMRLAAR